MAGDILSLMERTRVLADIPAFRGIGRDTLMGIAKMARMEQFDPGKVVIEEGEVGTRLYIVMSGHAEAVCKSTKGPVTLAEFDQGDLFGEVALMVPNTPRTATVKADTALNTLSFSSEDISRLCEQHPQIRDTLTSVAKRILLVNFIKRFSPFSSLDMDKISALVDKLRPVSVAANTLILNQGERGNYCYLLQTGSVDVTLQEGTVKRVIATLYPGAFFGEASLLTNSTRSAAVYSREASQLLPINRQALLDIVAADQTVAARMLELLQLRDRPKRREGVIEQVVRQDERGVFVVLKAPDINAYYQLTPEGKFLWGLLDGTHSLRDLTIAYFEKFKAFSPHAIAEVVGGLGKAGFLQSVTWSESVQRLLIRIPLFARIMRGIQGILEYVVVFRHVDAWFSKWYARGIRLLFSIPSVIVESLIIAAGIFGVVHLAPLAMFPSIPAWQIAAVLVPAFLLSILLHELAHGFAVKHSGREVTGVGVGWYWFGPIAFVDTSDMWLADRWPRIVVNMAGLWTNLVLAGMAVGIAWGIGNPSGIVYAWWYAILSYALVLFNLNPLMEYDGYYVLSDGLNRPNLRSQALNWMLWEFPKTIIHPSRMKGHVIDLIYGTLSLMYMVGMAGLVAWLVYVIARP